jgi:DNA-binding transcriptional ArsR family regulator
MMETARTDDGLDALFLALANPTRRAILARLRDGAATVAELGEPFDVSQPAISRHLRVLEDAGLVSVFQDAQRRPRRLEAAGFAEIAGWMESYRELWERRFGQLDALLEEMKAAQRHDNGEAAG